MTEEQLDYFGQSYKYEREVRGLTGQVPTLSRARRTRPWLSEAAGATDEEAMTAAHEAAGTVLRLPPGRRAQWPHTDAALIVWCWIVGTRTDRFSTEDEKATLAAIRRMNIPRTPHENPQDGEM